MIDVIHIIYKKDPGGNISGDQQTVYDILCHADFDVLVFKRAHQELFTHGRARAMVVDGKGTRFDPVVVDAFLACE